MGQQCSPKTTSPIYLRTVSTVDWLGNQQRSGMPRFEFSIARCLCSRTEDLLKEYMWRYGEVQENLHALRKRLSSQNNGLLKKKSELFIDSCK